MRGEALRFNHLNVGGLFAHLDPGLDWLLHVVSERGLLLLILKVDFGQSTDAIVFDHDRLQATCSRLRPIL